MCKLSRATGHECDLILVVAGYPVDLHTHDDVSYRPSLVVEGLVDGYSPFTQVRERPHLETKGHHAFWGYHINICPRIQENWHSFPFDRGITHVIPSQPMRPGIFIEHGCQVLGLYA